MERGAAFYVGGFNNTYMTPKPRLARRNVMALLGAQDDLAPALGGPGVAGLTFVEWRHSAYAYARAYGYSGGMASVERETGTDVVSVRYLDQQVQSYLFASCGHGIVDSSHLREIIETFLAMPPVPAAGNASALT